MWISNIFLILDPAVLWSNSRTFGGRLCRPMRKRRARAIIHSFDSKHLDTYTLTLWQFMPIACWEIPPATWLVKTNMKWKKMKCCSSESLFTQILLVCHETISFYDNFHNVLKFLLIHMLVLHTINCYILFKHRGLIYFLKIAVVNFSQG